MHSAKEFQSKHYLCQVLIFLTLEKRNFFNKRHRKLKAEHINKLTLLIAEQKNGNINIVKVTTGLLT